VAKAGEDLFRTPVPTEIPTDSFMEDYEPDYMKEVEQDLQLSNIESINKVRDKLDELTSSVDGKREKRSRSKSKKRSTSHGKRGGVMGSHADAEAKTRKNRRPEQGRSSSLAK